MKSCGCGEHQRTTENAQDEILCNKAACNKLAFEAHCKAWHVVQVLLGQNFNIFFLNLWIIVQQVN